MARGVLQKIFAGVLFLSVALPAVAAEREEMRVTEEQRQFWSFRPLGALAPPAVRDAQWVRNPLDAFIRSAQEDKGLSPAPEVDRRTLLRRAYLDVIGLPPTPEEVEAFLEDSRPDAYDRVIDQLLASPHYGERWARHWLDVARYADSGGYEFDIERPTAYHYRDFVIAALNDDMPYDQFVRWQLAGDEYAPGNPLARAATGFLTAGPTVFNQENEKLKYDEFDDMISTTGAAFLGLTVGCARCHDHKYDPIPTRDYYRMLAAFTTTRRVDLPMANAQVTRQWLEAMQRWEAALQQQRAAFDAWKEAQRAPLRAAKVALLDLGEQEKALLRLASDPANAQQQELRNRFGDRIAVGEEEVRASLTPALQAEWDRLAKAIAEEEQRKPKSPPLALTMQDAGAEPAANFLMARGDVNLKRDPLQLGFLSVLPGGDGSGFVPASYRKAEVQSTFQRTALAEWMVDPQHGAGALAARVMVNRLWHHHFGRGIVRTPSDFGSQGDRPSHPELLDWLAEELVRGGWKLKPLHRLLLTSATYRQSTQYDTAKAGVDPQNRLWWRREPVRMEAEIFRDSILSVTGCLNLDLFGPGIFPYVHPDAIATGSTEKWPKNAVDGPESWRRSIYIYIRRSARMPMMEMFDAPDTTLSCSRRLATVVPSQALELMNSRFSAEQATYLARRGMREGRGDPAQAVERLYELCLSRPASASEIARCLSFLHEQTARHAGKQDPSFEALVDLCQVLFGLNEFIYVD